MRGGISEGNLLFCQPIHFQIIQWEGIQQKSTTVLFAREQRLMCSISKIMSDLNLLSAFFDASIAALESTQNKIDKKRVMISQLNTIVPSKLHTIPL